MTSHQSADHKIITEGHKQQGREGEDDDDDGLAMNRHIIPGSLMKCARRLKAVADLKWRSQGRFNWEKLRRLIKCRIGAYKTVRVQDIKRC